MLISSFRLTFKTIEQLGPSWFLCDISAWCPTHLANIYRFSMGCFTVCQVAKSKTSKNEYSLLLPQIFADDECINFHSRQKRMCLPVTPWIITQSSMPENGLERTIRFFRRSTIKYLKLPPNPRAGQRLIKFGQENALVIANTLVWKHQRRLYTWTSSDGQHRNQNDYILCSQMEKLYTVSKNKTRSWLWLWSWTPYCQIQT